MNSKVPIHVCLMQPAGYIHAGALLDPALYFVHQFKRLGAIVSFERNVLRHDAINFVFGAHLGFDPAWLKHYSCIIVNLEQIDRKGAPVRAAYRSLLRTAVVADYDEGNPAEYASVPQDVPIVSFGYAPYLAPTADRALPLEERPVDILFVGGMNERRSAMIARIASMGRTVHTLQAPVYGSARDSIIRQAKMVLNLHYYDSARFEQVRAFVSLSNGTPMISERDARSNPGPVYEACINWLEEDAMAYFFEQEFGSQLFYEVMRQQLALFRQTDPLSEYAHLLEFATGVWAAHQRIISLVGDNKLLGAVYPRQLLPEEQSIYLNRLTAGSGSGAAPRFQILDDVDHQIGQIIERKQYDMALQAISGAVSSHYHQPGIMNHALYYPNFDRWLSVLASKVKEEREAVPKGVAGPEEQQDQMPTSNEVNLFIATELYKIGGHSRLLEVVAGQVKNAVVVVTDLFGTYASDPQSMSWIKKKLSGLKMIVVEERNAWKKALALADIVEQFNPGAIWYFQHQQDVVAFVGTLPFAQTKKIMVHHADHNPSLGCTLKVLTHVDVTEGLQKTCSHALGKACLRLPLYVPDRGAKAVRRVAGLKDVSAVTAGRWGKFSVLGPVALQRMAESVLNVVGGKFFHIGNLPQDALEVVRDHLTRAGISADRFVSVGPVSSLWETLKTLDADVYVGSAPFSGGTSAVEAQGCGYPVLPFTGFEEGALVAEFSSYADPSLGWADVDDLATRIVDVVPNLGALSRQARDFYESSFSLPVFSNALKRIALHDEGLCADEEA